MSYRTEVNLIIKNDFNLRIPWGPHSFYKDINTIARLESFTLNEINRWEKSYDFQLKQLNIKSFKTVLQYITQINNGSDIEVARDLINKIHQIFHVGECISFSAPLIKHLIKLHQTESEKSYTEIYNFLFKAGNWSRILHPKTKVELFKCYALINNVDDHIGKVNFTDEFDNVLDHYSDQIISSKKQIDESMDQTNSYIETTKSTLDSITSNFQNKTEELLLSTDTVFQRQKDTYEKLLALKSPMSYWKSVENQSKKSTLIWALVSFGFIAALIITSVCAYFSIPELVVTLGEEYDLSEMIRWFIISSILISVFIFGLRQSSKIAFSSLHMARDARERRTLAYLFLTLNKRGEVGDPEAKKIVFNALFSRTETGLLKGDSAPVFPSSGIIDKVLHGK